MTRQQLFRELVLAVSVFASLNSAAEENTESIHDIPSVATVTLEPYTRDDTDHLTVSDGAAKKPDPRPIDAALWIALKAEARSNPRAPLSSQILAPEEERSLVRFPGIGWDTAFPPDVAFAKSPQRFVEAVNSTIFLFDATGNTLAGTSLASFFVTYPTPAPFDPRVLYDRSAVNPRFYVVASQYRPPGLGTPVASIFLAVSRSPNPGSLGASDWCLYDLSAIDDFDGTDDLTFADQPMIGAGDDTLLISANRFTMNAPQTFTYALMEVIRKTELADNALGCRGAVSSIFRLSATRGDLSTFGVHPVTHTTYPSSFSGTAKPAYALSARIGSDIAYSLFRVRNVASGPAVGQVQRIAVNSQTLYAMPPNAPQRGSTTVIETGDTRVLSAVGLGNTLWLAHTTGCQVGGAPDESCARIVKFDVAQASAGAPSAVVREVATLSGGANTFVMYPAVAANPSQRIVVPFLRSSSVSYLSSLTTAKNASASAFEAPLSLAPGTCSRPAQIQRPGEPPTAFAGDYLSAQVEPATLTGFWVAGERATLFPPGLGTCTWDTQILPVN